MYRKDYAVPRGLEGAQSPPHVLQMLPYCAWGGGQLGVTFSRNTYFSFVCLAPCYREVGTGIQRVSCLSALPKDFGCGGNCKPNLKFFRAWFAEVLIP